ncbi:thioredoxin-like protein [Gaertneriomyces semiglobifer]|nr:thioredoxin-like protein [Gaertneriomyces semiglobifer]
MSEDTEWNDALRAQGIIDQKEPEITEDELNDMLDKVIAEKYGQKALEDRNLDELDELEDEEDERVLEQYRRQRIAEMQSASDTEKYGFVRQISKPEWAQEVTEASQTTWVVVHLFQPHIPACKLINAVLDRLAPVYRSTKFLKIIGNQCIENYPDVNCPTLLIYGEGDLKRNLVGIQSLGGMGTTVDHLKKMLKQIGALHDNVLTKQREADVDSDEEEGRYAGFRINRAQKGGNDDSDDDWDA